MRLAALAWLITLAFAGEAAANAFWAVNTRDADRAAAWYARNLGLEREERMPPVGDVTDVRIVRGHLGVAEIIERAGSPAPRDGSGDRPGLFKIGFTVDDLDAWVARWRTNGVTIVAGPFRNASGPANVVIRDADGNLLQAFEAPKP